MTGFRGGEYSARYANYSSRRCKRPREQEPFLIGSTCSNVCLVKGASMIGIQALLMLIISPSMQISPRRKCHMHIMTIYSMLTSRMFYLLYRDARLGPPKQYCDQPCLLHTTRTNIHNTEHSLMTTFLSRGAILVIIELLPPSIPI